MELFDHYRKHLKSCHESVKLNELVKMVFPDQIEIGEGTRICDFVFLMGPMKIGKFCDIQPGVVIWGGGSCEIGDYVSVGPNTVILTGEYLHKDESGKGLQMVDRIANHKAVYGHTVIGNNAYIGAGAIIRQGIVIGEGAVVGAGSFVNKSVPLWAVVVGSPAKQIGVRPCV